MATPTLRSRTPSLQVGNKAPQFALPTSSSKIVKLSDYRGKTVVLYFYPKDDTPGCTKEACSFQASLSQLARQQAVVLGVSADPVASHERFAKKFSLTFPLLSDSDATVAKAYGVWKQKSMYGRTYWGIERTTFVIDEDGRIAHVFPRVKVEGHTQEVLRTLTQSPGRGDGKTR